MSGTIACAIISLNRSIETRQIQQLHYQLKQHCSKKWQRILPLSTHSENSMKKFLEKYLKFLKNEKEWNFNEICVAASYLRGKNLKNPPLNVRGVIILPEVDGSGEVMEEEPVVVRKVLMILKIIKGDFAKNIKSNTFKSNYLPIFVHEKFADMYHVSANYLRTFTKYFFQIFFSIHKIH